MGGGGAQPQKSSTVQTLPKEVAPFYKALMSRASRASGKPYAHYGEKRFAGFNPDELTVQKGIRDIYAGGDRPELGLAQSALGKASQYAGNVPLWDSDAYQQYASPYFQDVIDVE